MRARRKTVEELHHTRFNQRHWFTQQQTPAEETEGSSVFPQRLRLLFTEQKERNLFSISASQNQETAKKKLHIVFEMEPSFEWFGLTQASPQLYIHLVCEGTGL